MFVEGADGVELWWDVEPGDPTPRRGGDPVGDPIDRSTDETVDEAGESVESVPTPIGGFDHEPIGGPGLRPTVVLVPGRGDASDVYPALLSDRLVAAGCRVVRFDPRDTGRSGDGGPTSTLADMATDVLAVIRAAAGDRPVHLVGLSLGGLLVVDVVTRAPALVASATFLSAMSPDPDAGMGEDFFAEDPGDPVEAVLRAMGSPTAADRAWVVDELACGARRAPPRPDAHDRHRAAAMRFGWPEPERLLEVHLPALVVHGTDDRVLPVAHARALAEGIDGADLHLIGGMGHLPTPGQWAVFAELLIGFVVDRLQGGGAAQDRRSFPDGAAPGA